MDRFLSTFALLTSLFTTAIAGRSSGNKGSGGGGNSNSNTGSYPSATYKLVKDYQAGTSAFWNNFNFFTGADPTNGFVKYVLLR
jgi:hypothetical protein